MKKFLAVNHDPKTGTAGVHDFDKASDRDTFLQNHKAEQKFPVDSEDDLIELLQKSKAPVLRRSIGVALSQYGQPAPKPLHTPVKVKQNKPFPIPKEITMSVDDEKPVILQQASDQAKPKRKRSKAKKSSPRKRKNK